jgi:hypothetical protein
MRGQRLPLYPPKADIRLQRNICREGPIVLQNDFGPWSEENVFQIKAE